jgi:tetratricopeptide (TPR) repeat protein
MESLEYVEQLHSSAQPSFHQAAFVLKVRAQRRLGFLDLGELSLLPAKLLEFIRSKPKAISCIRAAAEAASILETLRCASVAPAMQQCLSEVALDELEVDDTAHLLLAKAMFHYQMRNFDSSLDCAHEAVDLLEKHNHPNSVLAMLQNGCGAILARQGLYGKSIPEYLKCYQTSSRIGNDRIYVQASANLSLSYMRLGEYEEAITWGERSLSDSSALVNLGFGFQGAEGSVFSYAMTGTRLARADELILRIRNDLAAHAPAGISQAWMLYSADAYALMGNRSQAEWCGCRGIEATDNSMHLDFCAGPYARWLVRTSLTKADRKAAHEKLQYLIDRLQAYDALDQADILNARCWLISRDHAVPAEELEAMWKCMAKLPDAVGDQLRRMGMLDFVTALDS